jgi:hypothetical protein
MADEVVATYHWGDGLETSKTYSVKDYLQAVLSDGSYDDETVALVRSVADYGHWAQLFLSDNRSWKIGEDYAAIPSAHEMDASASVIDGQAMEAAASDLRAYGTTKHLENSDVEKLTASLSLESQTTINVTATAPSASKVTAKLADGTALGVTELGGGKWRVALTGIPAHQLGDQWNISIDAGGSDQATVEVSALAYANAAMASDAYNFLTRSPTRQSGRPEDRPLKPQTSVASCDSSCEPTGLTSTYGITRYEVCPCSASLRCSGSCAATPVLPNVDF